MFAKEPIDPVTPFDDRPSINELIFKHKHQIEEIQTCMEIPDKHDSLWILRFLLDHKTVKEAVKAISFTLQYRKEYKIDELGDIRHKRPKQREEGETVPIDERVFYDYWEKDSLFHTVPDANRGVVSYIIFCGLDQHGIVDTMSDEKQLKEYIYLHEWFYQTLDDISRQTGRLTKLLRIVDMNGMSLRKISRVYLHRDAKINKQVQEIYPQFLGSMLFINSPSWFQSLWNVLNGILPKRMKEKMNFVDPCKRTKDLDIILRYVSEENLPERYGGNSKVWPPIM